MRTGGGSCPLVYMLKEALFERNWFFKLLILVKIKYLCQISLLISSNQVLHGIIIGSDRIDKLVRKRKRCYCAT